MASRIIEALTKTVAIAIAAAGSNYAVAQIGPTTPLGFTTDALVSSMSTDETTGNGVPVDNGVSTAEALYTGNDGMVSLSIRSGSGDGQFVRATTTWFFTVLGPVGISNIPILLTGQGKLSIENATPANAVMDEAVVTTSLPGVNFDDSVGPNQRTIFNINSLQYVVDNLPYQISMMVSAYSFGGKTPSITASLDPFVQFDPSFNSAGFSLVASPLSPVPEPSASWLMLCGGLGLLALRTLRSRAAA